MKNSLRSSNWFFSFSILLVIASFVLVAKINAHRASSVISEKVLEQEEILVTIHGAVAKPGEYKVLAGTTLGEVLQKTRPKPNANIKMIPLNELIVAPLTLEIAELSEITVWVRGAVTEPVEIVLPSNSRICDLKSKISLTHDAEKSFFKRRKRLRDGEIIEVPKKTVEDN